MQFFRERHVYPVATERRVSATLARAEDPTDLKGPVDVDAIGAGAARLAGLTEFSPGDVVFLTISAPDQDLSISALAEVVAIIPAEDGHPPCAEFLFREAIPAALVTRLVGEDAGAGEGRVHPRFAVSVGGLAHWPAINENVAVRIEDLSRGGFRMRSTRTIDVGSPVSLQLDDPGRRPPLINAVVAWRTKVDNGYVMGCEFLEPRGFIVLQDHVVTPVEPAEKHDSPRRSLSVSIAAFIALCVLVYWLFAKR